MSTARSIRARSVLAAAVVAIGGLALFTEAGAEPDGTIVARQGPCEAGRGEVSPGDAGRLEESANRVTQVSATALRSQARVTVPVVFHVVTGTNGDGNVSDATIAEQIRVLNTGFAGAEAPGVAADTGFTFTLQEIKRWNNSTWFTGADHASVERDMMTKTRVGGASVLNVWSSNLSNLGLARIPDASLATNPAHDGVSLSYQAMPGGDEPTANLGKTLIHEVGHWLGLFHTFDGGCTDTGDEVDDTPAHASASQGCPEDRDTCPLPGLDPVHNYMNWTPDTCSNQFTPGQAARMTAAWETFRSGR